MSTPIQNLTIAQIAEFCQGQWTGPPTDLHKAINGIATLTDAQAGDVSWVSDPNSAKSLPTTEAALVIGTPKFLGSFPRGLVVADAEAAMASLLEQCYVPNDPPPLGIHPSAVVHATAQFGAGVRIGAMTVIGAECEIGEGTVIHPGVSLGRAVRVGTNCLLYSRCVIYDRCELGNSVILHAGAVIGVDGFGFIFRDGQHRKLPHLGGVVIEDDVEIGANTTVARGKLGITKIGHGTKIDSLCLIAHNVQVGPLCLFAGQSGLAGSVQVGEGAFFGGQTGVTHGVRIGAGVRVGAQTGIFGSVEAGQVLMGTPARRRDEYLRAQARLYKLPQLVNQVAELSKRVAELEASADHSKPR